MKPLFLALIGLFAGLSTPTNCRGQTAKPVAEVAEVEYEVLSAYVASEFTGDKGKERVGGPISTIVICDRTQADLNDSGLEEDNGKRISWKNIGRYLRKEAPELETATLDSFRELDTQSARFGPSFHLPMDYQLVDKTEISAIFKKGGWWPDYYKKYPNSQGFLTLSRVGFNPDGKQAIFYAVNESGGKCGTGTYVLMQKIDSHWTVAKEMLMWIS